MRSVTDPREFGKVAVLQGGSSSEREGTHARNASTLSSSDMSS